MKTKIFEEIEFFYLKFSYNKNVLIPRLDTESLVRKAILIIKSNNIKTLIDVWLWSGIIPISIEKNADLYYIYWLEKSSRAIQIAEENKNKHNSKLEIIKSDLLSFFLQNYRWMEEFKNQIILITANLPYIKDNDWINMSEDTRNEPKMALFWWKKTGFELYKKFYKQVLEFKNKFKIKQVIVIIEIWFDQRKVSEDFLKNMNIKSEFFSDLCWIERFIISYI